MIIVKLRFPIVEISTQPPDLSRFDSMEVSIPFSDEEEKQADLLAFEHFRKGFWVKKERPVTTREDMA